jgi:hypothetical protein
MTVSFGAFSKPLSEQIGKIKNIEFFQEDADNITRLLIRGILSRKEGENARIRLLKKIAKQEERDE